MKKLMISSLAVFIISSFPPPIAQAQDQWAYIDLISKKDGKFYAQGALKIDWILLKKVEASCDRYLIAGGMNVEAEWEQGPGYFLADITIPPAV